MQTSKYCWWAALDFYCYWPPIVELMCLFVSMVKPGASHWPFDLPVNGFPMVPINVSQQTDGAPFMVRKISASSLWFCLLVKSSGPTGRLVSYPIMILAAVHLVHLAHHISLWWDALMKAGKFMGPKVQDQHRLTKSCEDVWKKMSKTHRNNSLILQIPGNKISFSKIGNKGI